MAFLVKKRTLLLFLFVAILIASVFLMFKGNLTKVVYNNNSETSDAKNAVTLENIEAPGINKEAKEKGNDFFIDYKLERDRLRSQEADYLRELINNPNAVQQSKDKAQQDLIALSQKVEKEMIVENLIKAKGFEDAVIFLSDDVANVVVKVTGLKQNEVAQITDIVTKTTGINVDKITIIERK
jgi:stage III sporulation protein AH